MTVLTDPLGWFTLEVPEGWEPETDDCVTTLKHPSGVGIVYVAGARHAGGRQQSFGGADFLARFLLSIGISVDAASFAHAQGVGCRIYSYEQESGEAHWRFWSVTDDETVLLLSYTCRLSDVGKEASDVDSIVRSVRLFHSAPVH